MPGQNIQLADELTANQLIELGQKIAEISETAERLNLTKCSKTSSAVRVRLHLLRLTLLEALAILDGNPR